MSDLWGTIWGPADNGPPLRWWEKALGAILFVLIVAGLAWLGGWI